MATDVRAALRAAAKLADYVGMILPMAFQGKGSPKLRVRGLRLIHTQHLPQNAFVDVQGRCAKANALWQVWQRGVNNTRPPATCDQWLDLFTVDNVAATVRLGTDSCHGTKSGAEPGCTWPRGGRLLATDMNQCAVVSRARDAPSYSFLPRL